MVGGLQLNGVAATRIRVVMCLSNRALADDLHNALLDAGFTTQAIDDLDRIVDHTTSDEFPVVVIDDAEKHWLTSVVNLMLLRPGARLILMSDMDDPDAFLGAVMAGVVGFCHSESTAAAMVRTIESVLESGVAIPRRMVAPLVGSMRHGRGRRVRTPTGTVDVTDREWEVLLLLMQRRSTKEVAEALFVSVGTVRSHVSGLLHKLGALTRAEAVAMVSRGRVT